jgi:hypothetical protein
MDRNATTILAVIHQPSCPVVLELIPLDHVPMRVLRVIASDDAPVAIPKLD